jgi:hypothetical protein
MEHEEVVVSDAWFEEMKTFPGFELAADGASIVQNDLYTVYIYVRRRDWEKTQPPFGPAAQAARERIESARRTRYGTPDNLEPELHGHEYALLRNVNEYEMESFTAAEELITACRLKQRGIIETVELRGKVWEDEASRAQFFSFFKCNTSMGSMEWEPIQKALTPRETFFLVELDEQIKAAELIQLNVESMASARYIDSHPEQYRMGQDPRD